MDKTKIEKILNRNSPKNSKIIIKYKGERMKGKNYTAAEKYFMGNGQADIILKLETENRTLKEWVNRLLEYTELPLRDIQVVCEQDKANGKAIAEYLTMMNSYSRNV